MTGRKYIWKVAIKTLKLNIHIKKSLAKFEPYSELLAVWNQNFQIFPILS